MTTVQEAAIVSQAVDAPADVVYALARQMDKLPLWAAGLAKGITQRDGEWFADSPMGEVKVAMAPANAFGVLDHDVTLPNGVCVYNAFRVTPCGEGRSLLSFVVLRPPDASAQSFEADLAHVRQDLAALKQLVERQHRPPA